MLQPPVHQRHKIDWRDDQHRELERKDSEERRLRAIARMKELEAKHREDERRLAQFNCIDRRHTGFPQASIFIAASDAMCPTCGRLL